MERMLGMPFLALRSSNTNLNYNLFHSPGRHLAVNLLELVISDLLINYDIKYLDKRPAGGMFRDNTLPSFKGTLQIRTR